MDVLIIIEDGEFNKQVLYRSTVYPGFSLCRLYTGVWFILGSVYAGSIQESGLSMVQFKLVLYRSLVYPWFCLNWFYTRVWFKLVLYKSGLSMVQFKLVLYKILVYPWFCLSWFYTRVWCIHGSV
jgi:hypothetical protein